MTAGKAHRGLTAGPVKVSAGLCDGCSCDGAVVRLTTARYEMEIYVTKNGAIRLRPIKKVGTSTRATTRKRNAERAAELLARAQGQS